MITTSHLRPFNLRPVVCAGESRATHRSAFASYCYIRREPDADRFGRMPQEWASRGDLIATGRVHPAQTPGWARSGPQIWKEADASVTPQRVMEAAAFHIVLSLPPELNASDWQHMVEDFCIQDLASRGMIADWAIHHKPGEIAPHAHLIVTARSWRHERAPGRRHPRWFPSDEAVRAGERAWIRISGLRPSIGLQLVA
jgi:hypothetical protein